MSAAIENSARGNDELLVLESGGIATLTLNRPEQLNALSESLLERLQTELDRLANDTSVRVIVVAGSGRGFCSGHDLKELQAHNSRDRVRQVFERCTGVMMSLQRMPQPVIARVHGIATAAGCQLVAQCDLAVASADARFAVSGIDVGLFCSTPSVPLVRSIARKRALEMLFTGEFIDAHTAESWGLVNRVVPAGQLDEAVRHLAHVILSKPVSAVISGKRIVYGQIDGAIGAAYELATRTIIEDFLGDDARDGVAAFIHKRSPRPV